MDSGQSCPCTTRQELRNVIAGNAVAVNACTETSANASSHLHTASTALSHQLMQCAPKIINLAHAALQSVPVSDRSRQVMRLFRDHPVLEEFANAILRDITYPGSFCCPLAASQEHATLVMDIVPLLSGGPRTLADITRQAYGERDCVPNKTLIHHNSDVVSCALKAIQVPLEESLLLHGRKRLERFWQEYNTETERFWQEYNTETERFWQECITETERFWQECITETERFWQEYNTETERRRQEHAAETERRRQEHAAETERRKQEHAAEMERRRREHAAAMA